MPSYFGMIDIASFGMVCQTKVGYSSNMATVGLREQTEFDFGKRVRAERQRRNWSQEELARRLTTEKGIGIFASTIAKIESKKKPREVRLGEAVAIADLFEVSLDSLLGRTTGADDDLGFALRTLLDSVRQAGQQLSVKTGGLNHGMTELNRFDFEGKELLQNGVRQATTDFANGVSVMNAVEKLLEALSREVAEGLSGGNVLLTMGAMNALERALGQSSREVPDAPESGAHGRLPKELQSFPLDEPSGDDGRLHEVPDAPASGGRGDLARLQADSELDILRKVTSRKPASDSSVEKD